MRHITHIGAGLAALLAGVSAAYGEEICIKCTSPVSAYRCALTGSDVPAESRHRAFYCASRIAEEEDHATCAAVRRDKRCAGERRSYVYDPAAPVPLAEVGDEDGRDRIAETERSDGPPRTVVDLTRETARQTEESVKEAADRTAETTRGVGERVGDAVKGAASAVDRATRATFKCIGSWFDDC